MRPSPLLAALLLAWSATGSHAGWREEAIRVSPQPFPPPVSTEAEYILGWNDLEAARMRLGIAPGPSGTLQMHGQGGTTGWVRRLWQLDARYASTIEAATLRPRDSWSVERYRHRTVWMISAFGPDKVWGRRATDPPGASPPRWRSWEVPVPQDFASAFLLARSQPLREGEVIPLVVFPGEAPYLVTVTVLRREPLTLGAQSVPAIRASFTIEAIQRDGSLQPHRKFRHGTLWISDDPRRLPLRAEVGVFIGSVFAEIAKP